MPDTKTPQAIVTSPLKARALLLDAVAKLAPQVLQSLKDGPYQDWLKVAPDPVPAAFDSCHANGKLTSLGKSLKRWSERWHLSDPWCLEWALATFDAWRHLDDGQPLEWCPIWYFFDSGIFSAKRFRFFHRPWFPSDESWPAYRDELKRRFEKRLKTYREEVERRMRRMAEPAPREFRNSYQFYWLAGYQVCGWSRKRIGDAMGLDSDRTVGQALEQLANFIGLTLRRYQDYDDAQTVEIIRQALRNVPQQIGSKF